MNTYHDALELAKYNDSSWVAQIIEKDDGSYVDIVTLLGIQERAIPSYPKDPSFF